MKSNGKNNQSPRSESPEVLNSFAKGPVEELLASGLAPMWMLPSQGSGVLAEEKSPPPIQSSQTNLQPSKMELTSHSIPHNANDIANENVSTPPEEHYMNMTATTCCDSATGIASSCENEDDASMLPGNSIMKNVRQSSGESDTSSPKSGGGTRRGLMSSGTRLSLGSYSIGMPSLISINENQDSAFLVNESVTSFVEFGNDSTISFLDNSSRTSSGIDTSTRTTSSHARGGAPSYSSMPSLRSIQDNEDSKILLYDDSNSFGNSSATESLYNSFQQKSMILPIIADNHKPAIAVNVLNEDQRFAAESVTKEIISPPSVSQHLHKKKMEKRLLRWDAASHGTTSTTKSGSPVGYLPAFRTNAMASIMTSLKNDTSTDSVHASNTDLDSATKVLGSPQKASHAALAVVYPDGSAFPSAKASSAAPLDTRPAMAMRRPSFTADPSDSCSSQGDNESVRDEEEGELEEETLVDHAPMSR